jgi:hypothetical protein
MFLRTVYLIFRWIFKERHHYHNKYIKDEVELSISIQENQVVVWDKNGKLIDRILL